MLDTIVSMFTTINLETILWATFGALLGIAFGILPGIGGTLTVALLLPFTFGMPPAAALTFVGAAYCASSYGGSIPAILLNTPGTDGSAATILDGYPMTLQGRANTALGVSVTASFFGGVIGVLALILISPLLSLAALQFGAPEYFMLAALGLACISVVSPTDTIRGLMAGCFGLLLSTIGFDPMTGYRRYTFGVNYLENGVNLLVVTIGVFALSEVFVLMEQKKSRISESPVIGGSTWEGFVATVKRPVSVIRAALVGVFFGALPGIGTATSNYMAYYMERSTHKTPHLFGTGIIEGIIGPESSNNATVPATLIPTLTLGIPGNAAAAIYMGALIIQGLAPGPMLFEKGNDLIPMLFFGLLWAQIAFLIVGVLAGKYLGKIAFVPLSCVIPVLVMLSLTGAFAIKNSMLDVVAVVIMGFLGYCFRKYRYSTVAIVLGVVLGPLAERGFVRSMMLSDGNWTIFFTRPICLVIMLAIIALLFGPAIFKRIKRSAGKQQ